MEVEADLIQYHKSIASELSSTRDRIRNLIGSRHWQTDGEHKEAVLRKVLRNHVPDSIRVGRGFVFFGKNSSNQIDILITSRNKPTLFKDEDLTIVTRDAVQAIIEVKTKINSVNDLEEILTKLADNIELVRGTSRQYNCWSGLFSFQDMPDNVSNDDILKAMYNATRKQPNRAINAVVLGRNKIVRYIEEESRNEIPSPAWLIYHLEELAQAYFISYAVSSLSPDSPYEIRSAWFPLIKTQKYYIQRYISFIDGAIGDYPGNMMDKIDFRITLPQNCTDDEIVEYEQAVRRSGQVTRSGLRQRIKNANSLMFCYDRQNLIGVGAIKLPVHAHRQRVFADASSQEDAKDYIYELGWLYVDDHHRGRNIAKNIVSELITPLENKKIYATTREDNFAMQRILRMYGFQESGKPFRSRSGPYNLRLFVR